MATASMPYKQDHNDLLGGSPSQGSCHLFCPHWRPSYQPWSLNRLLKANHSRNDDSLGTLQIYFALFITWQSEDVLSSSTLIFDEWILAWVCIYMEVTEFDSFRANTPIPLLLWVWHSRKAWALLRCPGKPQKIDLNVMTASVHLSLQTIDRSEAVHLNLYLRWRNFTEQEVSWPPVCTGAKRKLSSFIFIFFNFILYSKKTKFLCAVQMVPSCGLTVILVILFFFFKGKQIPEKGWGG